MSKSTYFSRWSFKYDPDGNLTNDDHFNYEYNDLVAQTSVTTLADKTEVAKYEYDEEGLRTKKSLAQKRMNIIMEKKTLG